MIFLRREVASVSILPAVVQGSLDLFDACITNHILVVPVSLVETSDTLRKTIQHLCILLKEGLALQVLSCGVVSKWTGSNKGILLSRTEMLDRSGLSLSCCVNPRSRCVGTSSFVN
jgi:hypothetical protein